MTDQTAIQEAREQSIQRRATGDPSLARSPILFSLGRAGAFVSPWWSPTRDVELRTFWKKADHLSSAHYNMIAKMTAIPWRIEPDDLSDPDKVAHADEYTQYLENVAEYGAGWEEWYSLWNNDLLGTDNGAFGEIIGLGDADGPVIGRPLTISHLDSSQCTRSGDPEFPVLYADTDGKLYKLHYTRVMYASQMPSPDVWMNRVGFSAISRCINVAQTLLDTLVYKQEKLGSRPHRAMIVTQGGLDPDDVDAAFELANSVMDVKGLSRYSMFVVVGSQSQPDADVKMVDFASLPDGFDERDSTTLGMAAIALAYGVDARDLFPAMTSGSTRADALLQHIKQRGKGPGQIIQQTEKLFARKFLPPHLRIVFDFQDDTQDRQVADIRQVRAQTRQRDLEDGVIDHRTARELMMSDGEISRSQFRYMELDDGKLPSGDSVLTMFYSDDENIGQFLDIGVDNILNTDQNDPRQVINKANTALGEVYQYLAEKRTEKQHWDARVAIAALKELKNTYMEAESVQVREGELPDNRLFPTRRVDRTAVRPEVELNELSDNMRPGKDDRLKEGGDDQHDPFEFENTPLTQKELMEMEVKNIDGYRLNIRAAVRGYWTGTFDFFDFYSLMQSAIQRGFRQAWAEGAALEGISPDEYTTTERTRLEQEILHEYEFIDGFADAIEDNQRDKGGKLTPLIARAESWVKGYTRIKELAKTFAHEDPKQQWTLHPAEHCRSCRKLDGKVKRASFWRERGVYPKAWDKLECRNGCKCTLDKVTGVNLTPGPLPNLP